MKNWHLKKNKKCNLKRSYLKSYGGCRVETNIFRNSIQLSSKQSCFLYALPTWVLGKGLLPLQSLVQLPSARRAQRVNDEPVKVLNLPYFVYFIWKWGETLQNLRFFHFWTKAMLLLISHALLNGNEIFFEV